MSEICPFCERDPFHYVDIGVGMERVAVTCCELGIELFDHRNTGDVTMSREEFFELARKMISCQRRNEEAVEIIDGLLGLELGSSERAMAWLDGSSSPIPSKEL